MYFYLLVQIKEQSVRARAGAGARHQRLTSAVASFHFLRFSLQFLVFKTAARFPLVTGRISIPAVSVRAGPPVVKRRQ